MWLAGFGFIGAQPPGCIIKELTTIQRKGSQLIGKNSSSLYNYN
jgi:hypothetical protein